VCIYLLTILHYPLGSGTALLLAFQYPSDFEPGGPLDLAQRQKTQAMPTGPEHLPNYRERIALLKCVQGELPLEKLRPTGKPTLEKLLAKGWIELGELQRTYAITPAGAAALKEKIPIHSGKRPLSIKPLAAAT
jgi:hypothetical protein